jgi:hypothetical protein
MLKPFLIVFGVWLAVSLLFVLSYLHQEWERRRLGKKAPELRCPSCGHRYGKALQLSLIEKKRWSVWGYGIERHWILTCPHCEHRADWSSADVLCGSQQN